MDEQLLKYLNGVFANQIPAVFLSLFEDIIPHVNTGNNNLITTIREIGTTTPPELRKKWIALTEDEKNILKEANRQFWVTIYLEMLRDNNRTVEEKYDLATVIHDSLADLTFLLNGNEIMSGYADFLTRLKSDIKKLKKEKKKYSEYTIITIPGDDICESKNEVAEHPTAILADFELSAIWTYGLVRLEKLSKYLHDKGFTESEDDFKLLFSKDKQSCIWLKKKTSFLYLIGLITNNTEKISDLWLNYVHDRIQFKKAESMNPCTRNQLRTQSFQIREVYDIQPRNLENEYADIYMINKSTK